MDYTSPLTVKLTKKWFVLRHGQSEANVAGIVASQLVNAENAYGLTEAGREEVTRSVEGALDALKELSPLSIISSPFLRARQTAEVAASILGVPVEVDHRLAERDFGEFELLDDSHYENVWVADPTGREDLPGGAESVYSVVERTCDLILEVEKNPDVSTCLLVTHCDVAMILSCAFENLDPRLHSTLDPIKTGKVRRLVQA